MYRVAAISLALVGLAVSTVAASLAISAGEPAVTLLPFGGWLAARGLGWLTLARVGSVLVVWVAVDRWRPRYRFRVLAAVGLCWTLWGVWQAWLLLART